MPIAWPLCASIDSRFMSPSDSGSIAFRSCAAIGVAPVPVTAPIMSPIALPAAALSPDFCAASMRLPASSILRAISAMPDELTLTSPEGVLMTASEPGPGPPSPLTRVTPEGITSELTAARITIATTPQTITTAV